MKTSKDFHTVRGYQNLKRSRKVLTPSMEDYMEMIYRSCMKEGYIRINTLAELLNVQAPSVSRVVQKLKDHNLIDYKKYGIIQLTEEGKKVGQFLLRRHITIENFLNHLGVKETLMDTEMIEHNISLDTFEKLYFLNLFFTRNPEIMKQYKEFLNKNKSTDWIHEEV